MAVLVLGRTQIFQTLKKIELSEPPEPAKNAQTSNNVWESLAELLVNSATFLEYLS